ncbi:fimbria/pilus outer membrane usher protein [Spirochaeta africana]|uniref:fimbria/pilus outer membrane usher protein n=1 Tax=Spirochaeta africana TaxID=46355 RepID=UPI0012EA640D|nr:fimbria/pilus outer membrane usher protein [Spirochaeta africana]
MHSSLISSLEDYILPEILQQLPDHPEFIPLRHLDNAGLPVVFDEENAVLRIRPQQGTQPVTGVSLHQSSYPPTDQLTPGAILSSFLNIEGTAGIRYDSAAETETHSLAVGLASGLTWEIQPLTSYLHLYGSTVLDSTTAAPAAAEDLYLRYDYPPWLLSVDAGTVSLPPIGITSGAPRMYGIAIRRDDSLSPFQVTSSMGSIDIFLQRPSIIRILVDNQEVDKLELQAGPYRIEDIPLPAGRTTVTIEITDDLNRTERHEHRRFGFPSLLSPGTQQFSAAAGVLRQHTDFPVVGGNYHYGISPRVTIGSGLVTSRYEQLASLTGLIAAPAGNLQLTLASHFDADWDLDTAAQFEYQLQFSGNPQLPRIHAGARLLGPRLRTPSPIENPGNREHISIFTSVGQNLSPNLGLAATIRGSLRREPASDMVLLSLTAYSRHDRGANLSIRGSVQVYPDSPPEPRLGIHYSYSPGSEEGRRPTVSVYQDIREGSNAISAGMPVYEGHDTSIYASTNLQNPQLSSPDDPGHLAPAAGASLRLRSSVFEGDLSGRWSRHQSGHGSVREANLGFGTGLAYADGAIAATRPNRGAFVIAVPHPGFHDKQVSLSTESGRGNTRIWPWGTGIISNLRPYGYYSLYPDAPDLPEGYSFGTHRFIIQPGVQQGIRIMLGSPATVVLATSLRKSSGDLLPLAAGRVFHYESPVHPSLPEHGERFFSNRQGELELYDLVPGMYRIELNDGRSGTFTIPEDASGRYHLEAVYVE